MKWLPLALWALLYLQLTEPAESGFGSAWLSTATSKPCTSSWKGPVLPTGTWEGADGAGSISLHTMHPCPREGLPLQCWQEPGAAGSAGTRPLRPGEGDPGWGPEVGLPLQPCPGAAIVPGTDTPPAPTPADTCTAQLMVFISSCRADMHRVMLPAAP